MNIEKGNSRIVLIFKNFVIKFPRLYVRQALQLVWEELCNRSLLWHLMEFRYFHYGTIQYSLGRGLVDNWMEFCFYRKERLKFCAPTYYSFFGLFNIQARGKPITMDSNDLWDQLSLLTNNRLGMNAHHFQNIKNFGIVNGKFRILDYASKRVQPVLLRSGDRLLKEFNVNYKGKKLK